MYAIYLHGPLGLALAGLGVLGFRVWGLGFKFRVLEWGLGCRVQGLELKV